MVGYNETETLTINQKLIAGCISGCMTRFITQPLDYLKLRAQLTKPKKGSKKIVLFKQTRKILKYDGVTAFYRGHNLGQVHSIMAVSSQFYVYELLTKFLAEHYEIKPKYKTISNFFCATMAGCASTVLVMPVEVIRVRQMIAMNQYRGLIHGAKMVYKQGGFLAFYEGLIPSIIQMGSAVGVGITVFRVVQEFILDVLKKRHLRSGHEMKKLAPGNENPPEDLVIASTIAGCLSGFAAKTLTYPFDLTKKRMQIKTHSENNPNERKLIKCEGVISCMVKSVRKDGVMGLFRGWKVTIYKAQLTSVVAFTTYEVVCSIMREMNSRL